MFKHGLILSQLILYLLFHLSRKPYACRILKKHMAKSNGSLILIFILLISCQILEVNSNVEFNDFKPIYEGSYMDLIEGKSSYLAPSNDLLVQVDRYHNYKLAFYQSRNFEELGVVNQMKINTIHL